MKTFRYHAVWFLFCLSLPALRPAFSQQTRVVPAQVDRTPAYAEMERSARLKGHVPAWANAANDAGAVPDESSMTLSFVLTRAPQVEAAYTQLLADQQDPASPHYHQWPTPQQIGDLYARRRTMSRRCACG
jgi:hypothetical protein